MANDDSSSYKKRGKGNKKAAFGRKKKKKSEDDVIRELKQLYDSIDTSTVNKFKDFPLSNRTLKGLGDNGYVNPTEIQRESIALSLRGQDILGAAKTGSGKTLAFLIPVLEVLYCMKWTSLDGVGALIITPTRELAYQIFETLRKVGIYHDFSAGLIIGGKDLQFERKRMDQCNIVICTPGRLLQHMDENPLFDCSTMQILVLDEADRCLDLGFETTMNNIIENLPPKRQTLLFSATQTRSVRDLARLSLKDPVYVSVHEHAEHSTPESLRQSYMVCELQDKLRLLFSFIRNHLKQKVLVFMSSCKQVKYFYELFCRLRPGTSLLALYGTLHQLRRMEVYNSFCNKSNVVLFATDIAARGLDFPQVNWVVQLDCPEDATTYIHRVGRTARFHKGGESLLVLLPSEEEGMLQELQDKKIPISKIRVNPEKLLTPRAKIEAFVARDPNLKESAKRACVSYVKSVFLMKNKKIFNVAALDTAAFSHSLGLAIPPRIRILQRHMKKEESRTKDVDKTVKVKEEPYNFGDDDSDSDDGILKVKRRNHELEEPEAEAPQYVEKKVSKKVLTKVSVAKKILKKKIVANQKILFDEEGEEIVDTAKRKASAIARQYENEDKGGIDLEEAMKVLREEDKFDKQRFRERVKAEHRLKKLKLKKSKQRSQEEEEEHEDEKEVAVDSDEGSLPDLTWLPDPDKVFASSDNTQDLAPSKSEKRKSQEVTKSAKKMRTQDILDTGLSLQEDEELALQFLKS